MSTTWDLNRLRYTIRRITGKLDVTQLPDTSSGEISISNPPGIDDYINDFYLYDMPEHFRTLRLRDFYLFNTIPNCGTYAVPQNVIQIYDPIYIDNYQFAWYQDPNIFYRNWPEFNFIDTNMFTPNGSTLTFTFTLTQAPIQQGTVVIGMIPNLDGVNFPIPLETFTDQDQPIPLDIPIQQFFQNPGLLTGSFGSSGTIDYLSGVVTLTFLDAPPAGCSGNVHYHPYVASRPRDIMFFNQNLYVRPIPNDTYAVKCIAEVLPTTALSAATNTVQRPSLYVNPDTTNTSAPAENTVIIQGFSGNSGSLTTDLPQFNEWWQLIAYGASLKIMKEEGDHEQIAIYKQYFEEQKLLAQRKTLKQLGSQRITTNYAENQSTGNTWPIFPLY